MATELDGFREQCVTLSGVVRELTVELDACREPRGAGRVISASPACPRALQQENAMTRARAAEVALLGSCSTIAGARGAAVGSTGWRRRREAGQAEEVELAAAAVFLLPPPAGGALREDARGAAGAALSRARRHRAAAGAVATGGGDSGDQRLGGRAPVARANRELHATTEVSREAAKGPESFLESALSAISPEPVGPRRGRRA